MLTPFVIPVWKNTLPDFDIKRHALIDAVTNFVSNNPTPVSKSNCAGYQSAPLVQTDPAFSELFNFACSMAIKSAEELNLKYNTVTAIGWININDTRQAMNRQHIHDDVFSGVFYIKAPKGSGKLSIVNPGMNCMWKGFNLPKITNEYNADAVTFTPVEGEFLLWPSYLPHSVDTNNHDDARISIAFNILLE
jgi:uncharacterized protein (TIGR02466 family)